MSLNKEKPKNQLNDYAKDRLDLAVTTYKTDIYKLAQGLKNQEKNNSPTIEGRHIINATQLYSYSSLYKKIRFWLVTIILLVLTHFCLTFHENLLIILTKLIKFITENIGAAFLVIICLMTIGVCGVMLILRRVKN